MTFFDSNRRPEDEPCYVISVAARLLGVHQQTLRYYEKLGLVEPGRSQGNIRLYSARDIDRLQQIKRLMDDLGVNLAGVEVILHMTERMQELERELDVIRAEAEYLRMHAAIGHSVGEPANPSR